MGKNIKFSYFYRGGGNCKKYSFLIFANPTKVELKELDVFIQSSLIDETWFYAKDWLLPDLRSNGFDYNVDPTWHEFESIEYTQEEPNTTMGLDEFITAIFLKPSKTQKRAPAPRRMTPFCKTGIMQ